MSLNWGTRNSVFGPHWVELMFRHFGRKKVTGAHQAHGKMSEHSFRPNI